jgi:hypothetical protein
MQIRDTGLGAQVRPQRLDDLIARQAVPGRQQLAELASLTSYSPVRDIVSNPVPVAIDVARA